MNRNKPIEELATTAQVPRIKSILYRNIRLRVYSIGWLALMSGLAKVTLRLWERMGIIPKPMFKLAGNRRWYSPKEIEMFTALIQAHYTSGRDTKLLRNKLHTAQLECRKYYDDLSKKQEVPEQSLANEKQLTKAVKQNRLVQMVPGYET